jgi:biopolymer transport protein ExbD
VRPGSAKHRDRNVIVDITPMIDVVFLLIIFFMTTAQFSRLTRAEIDLPIERGERSHAPDEAGLVINITRAGEMIVSGRTVELGELESFVRQEIRRLPERPRSQVKLLIRADRRADAARLNQVVTMLRSQGVGSARLATEVPR